MNLSCLPFHHLGLVREEGIEPSRASCPLRSERSADTVSPFSPLHRALGGSRTLTPLRHRHLKPACLPFHHECVVGTGPGDRTLLEAVCDTAAVTRRQVPREAALSQPIDQPLERHGSGLTHLRARRCWLVAGARVGLALSAYEADSSPRGTSVGCGCGSLTHSAEAPGYEPGETTYLHTRGSLTRIRTGRLLFRKQALVSNRALRE